MLVACQIPLCDARLFSPNSSRLFRPDWPIASPGRDFVRGFGPVLRRRRGGHEEFHDESVFASAEHALRFDRLERCTLGRSPAAFVPQVAYRRLLCSDRQSGGAVVRIEVGLTSERRRVAAPVALGAGDWTRVALDLLELPVKVPRLADRTMLASSIWTCGRPLADTYLEATSPTVKTPGAADRRLVVPGEPLLLFEYSQSERQALPASARQVDPARIGGAELSFVWIEYRGRQFGIWFLLKRDEERALARRLRLGLLRLHAEHQTLRTVLSLLLKGDLTYERGKPEADLFDAYLRQATRILGRDEHGGFSHLALQEVIAAYQLVVNPDEQQALAERLIQARRQIRAKVEAYSQVTQAAVVSPTRPPVVAEKGDAIRVFVSYSHQDAKYLKPGWLLDFLSGLTREGFDFWRDEQLRGSELWDDRIREEINRADIALVLVSQAFLNSRYCQETEIRQFLDAARTRGLRIYPVILFKCDWKSHPWLQATQFRPRDGKTLEGNYKTRDRRDGLFLEILEDFRAIAKDIRASR